MPDFTNLPDGTCVVSFKGECDTDENDAVRHTGVNVAGIISSSRMSHAGEGTVPYRIYSVTFEPSGVWVFLEAAELADASRYSVEG